MTPFSRIIDDFLIEVSQLPLEAGREDINVALVDCFQFEQQLRHLFAQSRYHPVLTDDLYLGLIDVFELSDQVLRSRPRSEAENSFVWTLPDGTCESFPVDHLLPLDSNFLRPRGSRAIVPSLESFRNNFEVFTHGALSRLPSWDNVVVAGGSVLGCLSPTVDSLFNATNLELNELYQSLAYQDSDIDLFLYGLTHNEAIAKMHEIYESIRNTLPFHMICVRRANTVTIYTTWPIRPIQIVMRLYMSPSEILAGFDIDSACCLYNGSSVYVNPRGLAAIICQSNMVHMSRRSPSYEVRLVKYSNRGFEVYWPRLRRENIDYASLYDPFLPSYPKGLAFLIVAEMKRRRRNYYVHLYHGKSRVHKSRRLAGDKLKTIDVDEVQFSNNYEFFRIPYHEGINAFQIERMVRIFDKKANSKYNKINLKRQLHRHAVFAGTMVRCLDEFCDNCPAPQSEEERKMVDEEIMYIRGPARFIDFNPGRQMVGSFNPITADVWAEGAYIFPNETPSDSDSDVLMSGDSDDHENVPSEPLMGAE